MQGNKNLDHEKGFSLLRTDTIQLWVWLQGYQPLDEQPLKSLSEDISYRIRETSDVCILKLNLFQFKYLKIHFKIVCCKFYATL